MILKDEDTSFIKSFLKNSDENINRFLNIDQTNVLYENGLVLGDGGWGKGVGTAKMQYGNR